MLNIVSIIELIRLIVKVIILIGKAINLYTGANIFTQKKSKVHSSPNISDGLSSIHNDNIELYVYQYKNCQSLLRIGEQSRPPGELTPTRLEPVIKSIIVLQVRLNTSPVTPHPVPVPVVISLIAPLLYTTSPHHHPSTVILLIISGLTVTLIGLLLIVVNSVQLNVGVVMLLLTAHSPL